MWLIDVTGKIEQSLLDFFVVVVEALDFGVSLLYKSTFTIKKKKCSAFTITILKTTICVFTEYVIIM